MGSKLFAKAKGVTKSMVSSGEPAQKDVQSLQRENREREMEMLEKLKYLLNAIEHSPDIKLPQEKINKFHIRQRIAKMIRSLDTTRVTEQNEEGLDKLIIWFIECLDTALKNGYEEMAYWASIAVHHSTETLHIPVPKSDLEYANMLYERKYKYAETLKLVIEEARALDVAKNTLDGETEDFQKYNDELKRRKERHEALKQSKGGLSLIQSTRQKVNNRGSMNEEEQEVFENLLRIRDLSRSIKVLAGTRTIAMDALRTHSAAIQKYQSQLREKPTVEDEKIAARMKVIDTYFLQQLDARVSRTLAIDKLQDEFQAGMEQIASRVDRANAQRFSETLDAIEMEKVDIAIAARENAEMVKRVRDNQRQLEAMEQMIQNTIQEIEDEIEKEREKTVEIITEDEIEQDTEEDYEVEEEFG